MKTISKYVSVLLVAALTFTACDDWMNAGPEGATKTADQKSAAAAANPDAAAADISAIYWPEWGDSNSQHPTPKGTRTWCYMCMNYCVHF